jgi:type IV secretory pathway VirB10-like protein
MTQQSKETELMANAKCAMGLALAVFLLLGMSAAAAPQEEKSSAQVEAEKNEVKNFVLTTDKLDKYADAVKAIRKVQKDDPALKKKMDDDNAKNPSNTIADSVANIEKYPTVADALKNAGLPPRDFVVMTYTLINAAAEVQRKKAGTIQEYPDSALPENVSFVEKNYDRIKKIFNGASDSPESVPPK